LTLDGSTVTSPPGVYHLVPFKVTVTANQANELPFVSYLPAVETARISTLNPAQTSVVQDPTIPGYSLTIPAGVELRSDVDGSLITQMSITPVSPDRLPMPPPPAGAHIDPATVYLTYFFKPGGAIPTTPISQFSLPNDVGAEPGRRMIFWHFVTGPLSDLNANQWRLAGTGKVSPDGKRVIPDPGTAFTKFCCGAQFVCPEAAQAAQASNPGPDNDGDPVNLSTGQFSIGKTDYVLQGRLPIIIDRYYLSGKVAFNGPFGKGTNSTFEIRAEDTELGQAIAYTQADGRVELLSIQSDGTYQNTQMSHLQGTVLTKNADGSRTVRHKDGRLEHFNTRGRIIGLEDRNGNAVTIERNASDFLTRIIDASGRVLTIGTNSGGRITSIQDPIGRQVLYTYTANDLLDTVTDPAGGITRYTYDAASRMLTITDGRAITFIANEYDATGKVVRQTLADSGVYTFAYETFGATIAGTSVTDPRGNVTRHRFTPLKYFGSAVDAQGQSVRYTYDPVTNKVVSARDSLNRVTQYTYDAKGNVSSVVDPLGNTTLYEYEPGFNRVTKITDALNQLTRFTYNQTNGNLLSTIDPLNHATAIDYNQFGQPVSVTDALNNTTTFEYDEAGNLIATTDPLGNRILRFYDAVSRLLTIVDARGKNTQFNYDNLNRITQIQDAINGLIRFTYDANGNLLTVTDAKNQMTTYTYDNMNRLATRTDALNRTERYLYDLTGNLIQFTDRKGQVTAFQYDALNRRIQATYADATTTFTYDAVGRLVKASDAAPGAGAIDFTYDLLDRLIQEATPQGTVAYQYDVLGRRTQMAVNGQQPTTYQYDDASRLIRVAQGPLFAALGYDNANRRTSLTYSNGTMTSYAYDLVSRLTNIRHDGPAGIIEALTYSYDAAGNRLSLTRANGTASLMPNVVAIAVYDVANEQTQFAGATLTYDQNGNLTNDGVNTYTWDGRNRLISITGPSILAGFTYDVQNRRTSKEINGSGTSFLYDDKDIAQEIRSGIGAVNYLRSLKMDEPFLREGLVSEFFHSDALGSSVSLSDGTGVPIVTYNYEAFGRTTATGNSSNSFQYSGRENDDQTKSYYYRARYYATEFARFMTQDPVLAPSTPFALGLCPEASGLIWGLQEKIRVPEAMLAVSVNPYVYGQDNPLRFTDPTGLDNDLPCLNARRSCLNDALKYAQSDAQRACVNTTLGSYCPRATQKGGLNQCIQKSLYNYNSNPQCPGSLPLSCQDVQNCSYQQDPLPGRPPGRRPHL
jgi:RHS repeat-associated protein